ncbi:MAG: hypothetical protein FWF25_08215 [Propionibacteriaceae bacterium]|nr:hypothetical protein [Propionibacteriaceae bacterium]
MNRTLRTLVGLAASAALALSVVALAPSSASAASNPKGPYTVLESPGLTVHTGPGSNYAALSTIPKGKTVSVDCWIDSTSVYGDTVWGRVTWGTGYGYVADYWLDLQGKTLKQTTLLQCPWKGVLGTGYLDSLSAHGSGNSRYLTVTGWAADTDTLTTPTHVVAYIYRGSTLVTISGVDASGPRPDVHKVHPEFNINTGFSYSIALPNASATYTVKMYARDFPSGYMYPLIHSPKTITVK